MYLNYQTDREPVKCHPSPRQLAVEQMEFYAFAHFTVNTFTNKEWGDGTEDEAVFNPTDFEAGQWADALRSAGAKGLILTCKHHDGFCLWPTETTEHCVRNSPFRDGKGDVVREVSDACRRGGLKFGVYLSPWDRNAPVYGEGKPYDDFFCRQLTELCTRYGELFSVWFDGACGEGPNGKRQAYDWNRYYTLIRKLQPDAAISICGPDIRWCGNEAGNTRESEWSVLPTGFVPSVEAAERRKKLSETGHDLGSRAVIEGATGFAWSPSETDTSIRPGWFYHASEDECVHSAETLIDIWYRTVGGNSLLLLNIPPDTRGRFHETDIQRLRDMGDYIRRTFAVNLAESAEITADLDDGYHSAENVRTDSYDSYYKPFDGDNAVTLTFRLDGEHKVTHVVVKEHIPMSQRVERYTVEAKLPGGSYKTVASGTTIGRKKIAHFAPVPTSEVRVRIEDSRVCPILSFVGIY